MGYGEFGGTGSVKWEVRYDDTDNPAAVDDPKKRKKRDTKDGKFTDGDVSAGENSAMFVVCSDATVVEDRNGKVVLLIKLQKKDGQVKLFWGADVAHAQGALSTTI